MNDLLTQLNFQKIFFRKSSFDQVSLQNLIHHLSKYLVSEIRSDSPFILFTAYNHIKTIIAYYAIIKAGKIAVILDPQLKKIEIEEIIRDIDPAAIIAIDEREVLFNYNQEITFRSNHRGFIINSDLTDVCTIAYTNAEDGYSKGAMITEKNLLSEIYPMISTNKLNKDSITCALIPYSHLYGLIQGVLVPTHAGAKGLVEDLNLLKIHEIIRDINFHKVSHLYTVPSVYYILSKIPNIENHFQNIKEFYSGGIELPKFIFESFYNKTNCKIREGYGLTETSACAAYNYLDEGPVVNSFGRTFPGCEIKIIDHNGIECHNNTIGEICIKGDIVFKGYFNNENATNKVLKHGWLYTGDLGKRDNYGNFFFCGMKKEMINMAGNNVYPKKLERLIKVNNNVVSVNVYGEVSLLQGHTVGARIKLNNSSKKSQEELKLWCNRNINNTLLPKSWLFE